MAKKNDIDRSLLTQDERREYDRRRAVVRATAGGGNYASLPNATKQRLRTLKLCYWGIASVAAVITALVGASIDGVVTAVPFVTGAVFFCGCVFGTAFTIQVAFATERWASSYLKEIGYEGRLPGSRGAVSSNDSSDGPHYWATGDYDPERYYRETQGWSKEYREYVRDAYGDLDTYEANKPD